MQVFNEWCGASADFRQRIILSSWKFSIYAMPIYCPTTRVHNSARSTSIPGSASRRCSCGLVTRTIFTRRLLVSAKKTKLFQEHPTPTNSPAEQKHMTASKSHISPRVTRSQTMPRRGKLFQQDIDNNDGKNTHDVVLGIQYEENFPTQNKITSCSHYRRQSCSIF